MDEEGWLVGWREIGTYLGKSGKTAQRRARQGMPFFRDPVGRPIAKPSMIDEYILDLNQIHHDDKTWRDEGIDMALGYKNYKEREKEKERKEFDERLLAAQRPVRSRF
jgi:hypothetical protein